MTVSISILTENEAGGFFHNIVFIVLFNLFIACGRSCIACCV
jgi:hypothetical protein